MRRPLIDYPTKHLLIEWAVILAFIAFVGALFFAGLSLDNYTPPPPPQGTPVTACTTQMLWMYNPALKMNEPMPYTTCHTEYRMGGDK